MWLLMFECCCWPLRLWYSVVPDVRDCRMVFFLTEIGCRIELFLKFEDIV